MGLDETDAVAMDRVWKPEVAIQEDRE